MRLGVNLDHIATVREARKIEEPDPVQAALLAELGGADGITVHLRGDRRHIKERDVELLKRTIKVPLNVEMAATEEMAEIIVGILPEQVTLVPERQGEITTEGGLDVVINEAYLKDYVNNLKASGIYVSIFLDPSKEQIKAAYRIGVNRIEINTSRFSEAKREEDIINELKIIWEAARYAKKLEMKVFAGHGLNYRNVKYIKKVEEIEELNIGHSIIARAIFVGLERAVKEMRELIKRA